METEIVPNPVVKEKSMKQKATDGEIRWRDYFKYLKSKKNIIKEKSMKQKFECGEITRREYDDYRIFRRGFKNKKEYLDYLAQQRGFKDDMDKRNHLAMLRGFKDENDYTNYCLHKRGITRSQSENKNCTLYLGVHIAERVLSKIFDNVARMPNGNPKYDFICKKGYKIDVKSSCLKKRKDRNYSHWDFNIEKNNITDYFLLLAFDSRENLNPIHIWLIRGTDMVGVQTERKLNTITHFRINNTKSILKSYEKYEQIDKLEKLKECCGTLKNKKS